MARTNTRYICQACGAAHARWAGRCDVCGAWNAVAEESAPAPIGARTGGARTGGARARRRGRAVDFVPLDGAAPPVARFATGLDELDRVTGGGLVPGSAILIGGDPGIGKSTLLLQAVARLSKTVATAYISGEEAIDQIRMRAQRLGVGGAPVRLATATNVDDIVATLDGPQAPTVVVIDSIQTMYVESLDAAPGTVGQIRAAAQTLINLAKRTGTCVLFVGHVTKEGLIAGPRVLEHMVDTVLYFEGERGHQFRILRAVKNRFGPTDEIGVFEMTEEGLAEVANPSSSFLANRQNEMAGSAVFAGMEGSRPVLVEIQALVAPSPLGTPRRAVVGWDTGRLAMLLAVLEARAGLRFGGQDVYLNVAGGLRITEPAADLAVAAALASTLLGTPLPADTVVFGEVGLSGEIRPVPRAEARIKEAAKLGFRRVIAPSFPGKETPRGQAADSGREEIATLGELIDLLDAGDARAQIALDESERGR